MQTSESITSLSKALVEAQQGIKHPPQNATNPHLRNKFADLLATIDANRAHLANHGLCIVQFCGARFEDGVQYASVTTRLMHGESGEWIECGSEMAVEPQRGLNMQQALGIAYTYLRRYQWYAICGVAGDPDNDGNEAKDGAEQNGSQNGNGKRRPFEAAKANGANGKQFPGDPLENDDHARRLINDSMKANRQEWTPQDKEAWRDTWLGNLGKQFSETTVAERKRFLAFINGEAESPTEQPAEQETAA